MGGSLPPALISNYRVRALFMFNYFPHSSAMRTADVVLTLRMAEGAAGYGVYCMLLELLRDAEDRKLVLNPRNLAFALNVSDSELVERVIHSPGLFKLSDDGFFTSPWLDLVMSEFDAKKEAAREAGRRGAAARYGAKGSNSDPIAPPMGTPSLPLGNTPIQSEENKETNAPNHSRSKLFELSWNGKGGDFFFRLARQATSPLGDKQLERAVQAVDVYEKRGVVGHDPMFLFNACKVLNLSAEMFDFLAELTVMGCAQRASCKRLREIVGAWNNPDKSQQFRPKFPADYVLTQLVPLES